MNDKIFLFDNSKIKFETYQNESYHGIVFIKENEGYGFPFDKNASYDVVHHYHMNWERLNIKDKEGYRDIPFHKGTFHLLPEEVKVIIMNEHQNNVELVGTYGSDETHALSAWTSTSRELSDEKRGRMDKLLTMLATNGHHTPFEKSSIHFLVTTEIATHIQILKHRIGVSFNAESARYKALNDGKFYVPGDWPQDEQALLVAHFEESFKRYHDCLERLVASGMPRKRAKESARFYLPYANQLTADVMFNFRSFMHFQGLRNEEGAQLEIQNLAKKMLQLVEQTGQFNLSLNAFGWTKEKIYG